MLTPFLLEEPLSVYEVRTFKDIIDHIVDLAKIDPNNNAEIISIKRQINNYYQKLAFRKAYRWSGEERKLKLKAKYTTGTIAATNGSDAVTGTGTSWTEIEHLGCKLRIGTDDVARKIIAIDEAGQVAYLDSEFTGTTNATATYMIYKDEYGLYPDCLNVRKMYIPGVYRRLNPASPEEIDAMRKRYPFRQALPEKYSIHGYSHYNAKTWATWIPNYDFFEDPFTDNPRQRNLLIYPGVLTADKIATIRYSRRVPPMSHDDTEPLVPYEMREVLVLGPLVAHYLKDRDIAMRREWKDQLKDSLQDLEGDVENTDSKLILTPRMDKVRHVSSMYEEEYYESD